MMRFVHAKSGGVNGKRPLLFVDQSEMDVEGGMVVLEDERSGGGVSLRKRRKQFSNREENELEPVLLHIVESLDMFKLPNADLEPRQGRLSMLEFKQMIQPLCKLKLQVDIKVVFYHLLLNGVFILADSSCNHVALNPNYTLSDSFRGIIIPEIPKKLTVEAEEIALCKQAANIKLDDDIARPFSPYFCTAYLRAVKWFTETLRDPSAQLQLTDLFFHLVQCCQFEIDASESQVIGLLASKQLIRVNDDIIDGFVAPSSQFRLCHYSPITQTIPIHAM